jgi:hypothetical protein
MNSRRRISNLPQQANTLPRSSLHVNGLMSFIQQELDRIGNALRQAQPSSRYNELYAARQALLWAPRAGRL